MKRILTVVLALVLVLAITTSASALTLKYGSKGSAVKAVQTALNASGYCSINVDGVYGSGTVEAVKRFQKANSLTVDGKAGKYTLLKLLGYIPDNNPGGSSVMSYGSTGSDVRAVQNQLKALGYPVGSVDGTFGKKTVAAVRDFQSLNNLTVDGKVGSTTLAVLNSGNAAPYSKTTTYTILRPGATGSSVKKLQEALFVMGYYGGEITSYYSDETVTAVADFQAAFGLVQDGIAGPKTQAALYGAL